MDEDKKRLDIALFKYGLIAPVLQQQVSVQIEYFREVARKEHDVPHIGRRRFKAGTLKKWLKEYRHKGFEVLSPKQREDKGVSRKIDEAIGEVIREYVQRYAGLSSAALYRQMIAEGEVQPGQFNEGTLRKYIQDNELMEEVSPEPRKKFEHDHVNDLWIADTMHGPHIPCGRKNAQGVSHRSHRRPFEGHPRRQVLLAGKHPLPRAHPEGGDQTFRPPPGPLL